MIAYNKKETVAKVAELYEQMNQARRNRDRENAGWDIERLCKEMVKQIDLLRDQETDPHQKIIYTQAASHLRHTSGKEVGYIDSAYRQTLKSNAAKVRTKEYHDWIDKALRLISVDIGLILIEAKTDNEGDEQRNPEH